MLPMIERHPLIERPCAFWNRCIGERRKGFCKSTLNLIERRGKLGACGLEIVWKGD
jgi:hypothetical protein